MTGSFATADMVACLEQCWRSIRNRHPDVPAVVVTIGSGSSTKGRLTYGHFAAARWQHGDELLSELFIGGEGLQRGARAVLGTLLHEATHGIARTRGIYDTSRQGRYHNTRFRELGHCVGLELRYDSSIGWSPTELAAGTAAQYADELAELDLVLTVYRHPEGRGTATGRRSNDNPIPATCSCPRRIRVARTVLALGDIQCGLCGTTFTPRK